MGPDSRSRIARHRPNRTKQEKHAALFARIGVMAVTVRPRSLTETLFWIAVFAIGTTLSAFWACRALNLSISTFFIPKESAPRLAATQFSVNPLEIRKAMHVDYESRLKAAMKRGRKPPSLRFLRWLHIPKTGTSLVNTLVRWGCTRIPHDVFVMPRRERPADLTLSHNQTFSWDWLFSNASGRYWLHQHCYGRLVTKHPTTKAPRYSLYIHKPLSLWEIPHAVIMFRIPRQRIYSNFLHLNLHYNESKKLKESLYSFLHRSEYWSQHAKLLLGRTYRDKRLINEREARFAANLVTNHVPFVGLTEEFRLSCRLFHAKFGGVPHLVQFENVRPSLDRYKQAISRNESFRYDETQFKDWVDSADEMVYAAAQSRFWNDVAEFKEEIEKDMLGLVHIKPYPERYHGPVLNQKRNSDTLTNPS